jgi:CheY-like chemotaxis protein
VVHRVLVIDDNEAFRETLVELLTSETPWVTVTAAANGRVALELLNGGLEPCLAFLDLKMPVMSGWEFLDEVRMRNLASGMQVVLVSGRAGARGAIPRHPRASSEAAPGSRLRPVRVLCLFASTRSRRISRVATGGGRGGAPIPQGTVAAWAESHVRRCAARGLASPWPRARGR